MDLAITIDSTTFQPGLLDQSYQSFILLLAWRRGLFQPRVEATSVNPQGLAQGNDTVPAESGGYERVPFLDSLAKYAAVDSIGQRNNHVKTCSCGGLLNETNIYSKGKSVCF